MSLCMKRPLLTGEVVVCEIFLINSFSPCKLLGNLGGPRNSQQVKNSDIWNEEDIPEGGHREDEHDPRPAPE